MPGGAGAARAIVVGVRRRARATVSKNVLVHRRRAADAASSHADRVHPLGDRAQAVGAVVHRVHARRCWRAAPARCRCCWWPSPAGCAARASAAPAAAPGRPAASTDTPDEPAGQVALVLVAGGEEPGVRAAVAHRHAEALRGADHDVGAPLPRRGEQHQREQVGGDRDQRALRVEARPRARGRRGPAGGAGVLQQHAEHALGGHVGLGLAHDHVDAERLGAGAHDVDGLRVALGVDEERVAGLRR